MLVNGAPPPVAKTAQGWLRFRVLNGSNARNYHLAVSDDRSFYMIATDGGLLEAPVETKLIEIHPGERFDILVDARDGKPFDLVTQPVEAPIRRLPPDWGGPACARRVFRSEPVSGRAARRARIEIVGPCVGLKES